VGFSISFPFFSERSLSRRAPHYSQLLSWLNFQISWFHGQFSLAFLVLILFFGIFRLHGPLATGGSKERELRINNQKSTAWCERGGRKKPPSLQAEQKFIAWLLIGSRGRFVRQVSHIFSILVRISGCSWWPVHLFTDWYCWRN